MVRSLRCPQCTSIVTVAEGQAPVCPSCGFSGTRVVAGDGSPPGPAGSPAPASSAVAPTPSASRAFPASPSGAPPGTGPPPFALPPIGDSPATRQVGKTVHPAIVVLLHVVTVGIYFFVFWWRASREADAAHGASRAHGIVKTGVWLTVGGIVLVAIAFAAFLASSLAGLDQAELDAYGEEQFIDDLRDASFGLIFTAIVAALALLAGRICILVGQYRAWKAAHALEVGRGDPKPLPVGWFLGVSIAALVLGNGGRNSGGFTDFLEFAALVAYLVLAALTQAHLNRLWKASPPAASAWSAPGS